MPNILRAKGFLGIVLSVFLLATATQTQAQVCTGFPSILALGSSKNPNQLCSPVTANLTYNVTFASPTPAAGTLQIEYNWDDGSAPETFTLTNGLTTYNHNRNHPFPANSDCEFNVVITLVYNGTRCASTRQVQKVASWRTDEFNGGNVQLISPTTGTLIHEVCRGEDISVVFTDDTQFNCNQNYVHAPGPLPVETPNTEDRWQQIVYNTPIGGAKIPNLSVNGVPVTGPAGANIIGNYQDPRGVFHMPSPVLVTTAKRPTLVMTAAGGFTAGFPQVGDEFEITLRYWNFCNPYDDPNIPGLPADLINGDNAPVERTSLIRIVAAPAAPTASTQAPVCFATTPSAFSITGVPANNVVSWYRNVAGAPDTQGTLITSGVGLTSLPVTSHPNWVNNTTPGIYKVWATYRPNVVGALNCESPAVQVIRTIRERPAVPTPTIPPPTEICNGSSFMITMPAPATETIGGATQYTWTGSAGVSIGGTTANTGTFNVNVTFAAGETFVDRTVTVGRRFTSSPSCSRSTTFNIRVFRPTVAGTPSASPDICETTPVGSISLSGHIGDIIRWEVQKDGGGFTTYTGPASGNSITPGLLSDGIYQFQAVVQNANGGPCAIATSGAEQVTISDNPNPAFAGADQDICTPPPVPAILTSAGLGASNPAPGTGKWTVVAKLPVSRPDPLFLPNDTDPNAQIQITSANAGAYTLRWTVTSGVCTSFDDVIVDFGANPTDPTAGPDDATCGETYTLQGNEPGIGFGKWTIVSGPGACAGAGCPLTIANDEIETTQISLNAPFVYGAYTLQWTITSGGSLCNVEQDQVTITFDEPINVADLTDIYLGCLDPAALPAVPLSGTFTGGGISGVGHWEVVSGNGTVTGTVGASPVNDSYTVTLSDYDDNVPIELKFLATGSGECALLPPDEEFLLITFDPKPVANAGTNIGNICGDQVSLDAESPAPFTAAGVWSSPDPALQFFSSVDQVTPDNTDPKAIVKGLKLGANTVTWTLTYTSPNPPFTNCVSDPATITLTRVPPPAPIDFDVFECEIAPAGGPIVANVTLTNYEDDVTSLTAAQRQITWFKDGPPPAGALITNPSNPQNNIVDGQIYSARIRELATNCISDATVTIHVRPLAPAVNASAALCEDTPGSGTVSNIDLTQTFYTDKVTGGAVGVDVHWFQTLFDAQTNDPLTEITAPFDIAGDAQVVARITYSTPTATAPACPDFAVLDLIINTIPTGAVINGDPTVCMGLNGANINDLPIYTYQVTSIPGATYVWSVPTGAGQFVQFGGGGVNDFFVILKFPFAAAPPVLDIGVSVVLNSCTSAPITLSITREEVPGSPVVVGFDDVCQDLAGESYSIATPSPSSDYIWTITKQSDGTNGGAFIVAGQGQDEIFVDFTNEPVIITVKEQNAVCAGPDVNYPVAVNLYPTMQTTNPSICSDSPTGIIFTPDALSVPVDHFDILSVSTTAGINYITPAGGPAAQNNVAANAIEGHVFENLQAVPLTVNYTVQPVSVNGLGLNCAGPAKILIVNVLPEPQLDPNLSKDVCSEQLSNILLLSESGTFPADGFIINSINVPAGVTPTDPNFLLVADGLPKPGTIMQSHAYLNTTSSSQVVAYSVSPHATFNSGAQECIGNPPIDVYINVHPRTIVDEINTATPICNGDLIDVTFGATGNTDATFQWSVKSPLDPILTLNSAASGTGNIVGMNVSNSSQSLPNGVINLGVRAKNTGTEETASGCVNPEVLFQVEIRPSPIATSQLLVPACSDSPGGSTFTADLETLVPLITPIADVISGDVSVRWWNGDPSDPATPEVVAPALNAFPMQTNILFVTVTNVNTSCTKVVQASYDVKPNIGFSLTSTDVKCASESNGLIDVLVNSGNPQYLYSIRKLADPYGAPVSSTLTNFQFKFLEGDVDYMVKVESQSNPGCLMEQPIRVEQPDPLSVVIPTNPVLQEISCFGLADGQIQANATGGTPPYQFTLSNTGQVNATGTFANLSAGTYLVAVKDKNGAADGCPASASVTIDDPDPVIIRNMIVPTNALGFQLGCNNATDGSINFELETTGGLGNNQTGTENFTYILKKDNVDDPSSPIISTATSGTFPNMGAGNYQLVARDMKNCESSPKFVVIVNPPPFDPGVIGNPMSACNGVQPADLFQIAPPFGGLGNFDFEWQVSIDEGATWTAADPVGNNDKNPGFVFDAAGLVYDPSITKYMYRRQVITAPGISSCAAEFSNEIDVVVNPTPIAVAGAISPLCEGSSGGQATLTLVQGTYPVRYDFEIFDADPVTGFGKFFNNLGGDPSTSSPATVFIPSSATTSGDIFVRFSAVRDANGCAAADPADEPITVIPVNANFTLSDNDICSGESIDVSWNRDNDLDYVLTFGDGEQRGFPFGNGDINPQTEAKVYVNNSTSNTSTFQVTLKASYLAGTSIGCEVSTFQNVTVQPTALVNLLPGEKELCSGEFFEVRDQSLGVTGGQWMVAKGTDAPIPVPGGDPVPGDLSEQMFNTLVAPGDNPTAYTFTYVPEGGTNCPVAPVSFPVNVYAMPTASFTASDATPDFVGGVAEVTFTNTSSPFDPSGVVQYAWEYGETGAAVNEVDPATHEVDYFTKANKTVILTATNTANDRCETRFTMLIDVEVPGLAAAFTVTPRFACVPVTIKTENLSAGADRFEWDLITPNNSIETTTITEPEWTLTTPGVYTIRHRAGVIGDATTVEATPIVVEVYESPFAQFEIFLNQAVYIGTEVRVTNGTLGADTFSWNFGDHPESENKIDFQPVYAYASEGNYDITLTASKDYGPKDQDGDGVSDGNVVCVSKAVRPIFVRPGGSLKIPNAFTPNESNSEGGAPGDGTTNDFFLPIMDGVEEFTMQIFDRWGTLVFESREKNKGWNGYDRNGRIMPAGVYVYKIVLRLTDDSRTTKIGDVTLIR